MTTDVEDEVEQAPPTRRRTVRAATSILSALIAGGLHGDMVDRTEAGRDTNVLTVEVDGNSYWITVDPRTGELPSNIVYELWDKGQPHEGQVIAPLPKDDPAYYEPCFLCVRQLGNGQPVRRFRWGPTTQEDRYAHWEGQPYSALTPICHDACVRGEPRPTE